MTDQDKDLSTAAADEKAHEPELSAIKLVDDEHLAVFFSKLEKDGSTATESYTNKERPIHYDVKKAFMALAPHLGTMCLWIRPTAMQKAIGDLDPGSFDNIKVTALSLKNGGIVITGSHMRARDGAFIIINSPFEKLSAEISNYEFLTELNENVLELIDEAKAWMEGAKRAPISVQQELPLEEEMPELKP